MVQKTINFDDKKVNKTEFYKNKKLHNVHDIDTEKIFQNVSKKESYGKKGSLKYFVAYNDEDDTIRPLCLKFPPMIGYIKNFDGNKTMSFKVNDKKLLKNITKYGRQLLIYWMYSLIVILSMVIMKNILRPK